MSGFLHRLAAQALGQTEGVRPAPQPRLFPASLPAEIDVQADPTGSRDSPRAPFADKSPSAPIAEAAEDETAEIHTRPSAPQADPAIVLQAPSQPRAISPRIARRESHALAQGPAAEPLRSAAERAPTGAPRARTPDLAVADRLHEEHPAHSAEPDPHTRLSPPMRRSAQDLHPPQPRPSRVEVPRRPAGGHRAPDVHIHIGRVELTALAAPTPPRREPRPAKKATSLDDYLRGRNGRSS